MSEAALLVVEDEPAMAIAISSALEARGYLVTTVASGQEAIEAIADFAPMVVLLDLGLPDIDGLEVCRSIREWSRVPIIVLTADGAEDRKIDALDCGADDYITKPFSTRELLARVRVAIRHQETRDPESAILTVGDVVVDLPEHRVRVGGVPIDLTPKEFGFLAFLARYPGRILTHRMILTSVWGPTAVGHVEYLRVYARALRLRLEEDPEHPRLITEAGVGYRLVDRSVAVSPDVRPRPRSPQRPSSSDRPTGRE